MRAIIPFLRKSGASSLAARPHGAPSGTSVADRLAERLAHERRKVAKVKLRLEAEQARVAELTDRLAAAEAAGQAQFDDYRYLRKLLRWHYATHPDTKREWKKDAGRSDPFAERAEALKARLVDLMSAPEFAPGDRRVTAVVTSCGRHGLLQQTLTSFFRANPYPELNMIVVEDGEQDPPDALKEAFAGRPIEWINTGGRVGQIAAIDIAYSRVRTPYIFHMEDDFRFVRPGFIDKALTVLEAEPMCLQVWAKRRTTADGHGPADAFRTTGEVVWRPLAKNWRNVWHGFSFNPNLRRLREYRLVGSCYADVADGVRGHGSAAEAQLSELYGSIGYFAAMVWEDDGAAFVHHKGGGLRVS